MGLFGGGAGSKRVDGREAWRLVREANAFLLDVRTPEEFAEGHAEGARNIPVQELAARFGEVPAGRPVVVYCRSGGRSASAGALLSQRGVEVYDAGGIGALVR
jgi:rhodanese-related sulfurtransferase